MATNFIYEQANIATVTPTAYTYYPDVANIYSIGELNSTMDNVGGKTGISAYSVSGGSQIDCYIPSHGTYIDVFFVDNNTNLKKAVYTSANAPDFNCLKDANIQDFYIDVTTAGTPINFNGVDYYRGLTFTIKDRTTRQAVANAPHLVLRYTDTFTGKIAFQTLITDASRYNVDANVSWNGDQRGSLYPASFVNMNSAYGSYYPNDGTDYFMTFPDVPFSSGAFNWRDGQTFSFAYTDGKIVRAYTGNNLRQQRNLSVYYTKAELLRFVAILGLYFEFEGTMYLGYMDESGQTTGDYLTADEWGKSAQWDSDTINNFTSHRAPVEPPLPSQDNRYDDIGLTVNGNGQSFLKNYAVTGGELTSFLVWCNSENVPEGMNPMDYVVGVSQAPCSMSGLISAGQESTIYVGRENTGVSAYFLGNQGAYTTITIGTYDIPNYHDNFLNYEPYTHIDLYIPYCGTVTLPPSLFCGSSLKVDLIYDIFSGECAGVVYCNGKYYTSISGNFMTMQPISTENTGAIKQAVINGAIGVIGGAGGAIASLAMGNVIGGVVGAGTMITSAYKSMVGLNGIAPSASAGGGGRCNFYKPNKCILYITSPDNRTTEDFYKINGGVVNAQRTLAEGDGFTQVAVPVINGNMTIAEKNEIENYLKTGVIL